MINKAFFFVYIPVIVVSVWSVLTKIFYDIYKEESFINHIYLPTSVISFFGTVFSLLLSFRNKSAYDRYWEGRKIWGNIINLSRNLSRTCWVGFDIKEDDPEKEKKVNLKIGALRLIMAWVVSIKHSLRGEKRMNYDDLADLIKHLPRFYNSLINETESIIEDLPLKIAYYIESFGYVYLFPAVRYIIFTTSSIINNYTSCQRIIETPIPIIYRIHLKHVYFLYFLFLPIQLIGSGCGWTTIVLVILIAFTFFGIEEISSQIENPFGYDENDLMLDKFCQEIQDEIDDMMKFFPSTGFHDNLDWLECEKILENTIPILDVIKNEMND